MRTRCIVTYDISDDDRRTRVFKALRGFGDHIQYTGQKAFNPKAI